MPFENQTIITTEVIVIILRMKNVETLLNVKDSVRKLMKGGSKEGGVAGGLDEEEVCV